MAAPESVAVVQKQRSANVPDSLPGGLSQDKKAKGLARHVQFPVKAPGIAFMGRLLDELNPDFVAFADMIGTKPRLTGLQIASAIARSTYGQSPHAIAFLHRVVHKKELNDFDRGMDVNRGTESDRWAPTEDMLPPLKEENPLFTGVRPEGYSLSRSPRRLKLARMCLLEFDGSGAASMCIDRDVYTTLDRMSISECLVDLMCHSGLQKDILLPSIVEFEASSELRVNR
ncbi:hypothetical protein M427DRAFT_146579 [Gonapodya prolifera JEL478]|uniref:Uncharacterized protein n=1 Tax=Gonapodya prolifera (strain JEL478) TaxID=1344416 RepID=A0A139A976_GONPJ|nr:hypothetical protein M427DRAFT_146579 [Gonapodya prolifera JEL478]|eukprot:KXS13381.1 hypothetical protein M427DRAFT_146579 [Gonapodya prolifera JEL478]